MFAPNRSGYSELAGELESYVANLSIFLKIGASEILTSPRVPVRRGFALRERHSHFSSIQLK